MQTWHAPINSENPLQILELGYGSTWQKNKWGPGRRNFYILHYVLEGKGYFNGISVKEGQGFLITPMMSVEYHPDQNEPWKYFWICFNGDNAENLCEENIQANDYNVFDYDFKITIKQIIDELYTSNHLIGNLHSLSIFYRLLSSHERCQSPQNSFIEKAIWYMNTNYHQPITITQIASICGINDRYMYNLFMRHLGTSPKQYLNDLRLRNAVHILKNSDCSITEVAYSVGFTDVMTFSRFFSKHFGVSPSNCRKNHDLKPL